MTVARPVIFWITIAAIVLVALVLLRPILMPFAVGMALAYLLAPVVDRLERVGVNRSLAALTLVLLLLVGMAGIVVIMLPALVGELNFFIEQFPRYVARMQALIAESSRPWLHTLMGEELHIGNPRSRSPPPWAGPGSTRPCARSGREGGLALASLAPGGGADRQHLSSRRLEADDGDGRRLGAGRAARGGPGPRA